MPQRSASYFQPIRDGSKLVDAIVDECGRFFFGLFERARADSADAVELLLNLSLAHASGLETHLDHAKITLSWTGAAGDPVLFRKLSRNFQSYVDLIESTIREGMASGSISAEIDARFAAWAFMGYAFTVGSAKLLGRPPEWISQLQIAILRHLLGHEGVDRVLTASRPRGLSRSPRSP